MTISPTLALRAGVDAHRVVCGDVWPALDRRATSLAEPCDRCHHGGKESRTPYQVGRIKLFLDLPRLVTVDAVQEELEDRTATHPYLEDALTVLGEEIPVVTPSSSTEKTEEKLLETLDLGEAQALAVAEAADGMIVTDDGDARATAKQRGVDLTGSIGLVVRFVEDGYISAKTADGCCKRWIDEAGFRSPARDFEIFLED